MYLFATVLLSINGCEGILRLDVEGDGNFVSIKRNPVGLERITEVELQDYFTLEVYQSDLRELYVDSDANLNFYVVTEVVSGRLIISRKSNFELSSRNPIKLRLYIDTLKNISVYNEGALFCDTLELNDFKIFNHGASSITTKCLTAHRFYYFSEGRTNAALNGCFGELSLRQLGSGALSVTGMANTLTAIQEGSGVVNAYGLNTPEAKVSLYGSGLVYCSPHELFNAKIIGKGRIYYTGNPQITSSVEGGGLLMKEGF